MPRGYLRRKGAEHGIGRKAARGGSSRQATFHRTPRYRRNEKDFLDHDKEVYLRSLIDDEINGGIDAYFDTGEEPWAYGVEFSHGPKENEDVHPPTDPTVSESASDRSLDASAVVKISNGIEENESFINYADADASDASEDGTDSFFDVEAVVGQHNYTVGSQFEKDRSSKTYDGINENGSFVNVDDGASTASYDGTDSFFDVEVVVGRHRFTTESRPEQDYSLCGASSQGSESFSLISTLQSHKEDMMDASTASTPWEIVAGAAVKDSKISNEDQGVTDLHITCLASTEIGEDNDSVSCISATPTQAKVGHISDVPPRLFVPKQCVICMCEKKDVLRLMHKCHHPEACLSCLRTFYVDERIKNHSAGDVSNLPLRCFWPGCDRILRDVQIRSLVRNDGEMKMYYDMTHRVKETQREERLHCRRLWNFKVLQECSECSATSPVYPSRGRTFSCPQCNTRQKITVMSAEDVNSIVTAAGDVIVNCPACKTLIVRDGGCDHMTCIRGREFSFSEARKGFDVSSMPAVPVQRPVERRGFHRR